MQKCISSQLLIQPETTIVIRGGHKLFASRFLSAFTYIAPTVTSALLPNHVWCFLVWCSFHFHPDKVHIQSSHRLFLSRFPRHTKLHDFWDKNNNEMPNSTNTAYSAPSTKSVKAIHPRSTSVTLNVLIFRTAVSWFSRVVR